MKLNLIHLAWAAAIASASTLGCPGKERTAADEGSPTAGDSPTADRSPADEGPPPADRSPADDLLLNLSKHEDGVLIVTTGTEHFGKGLVTLLVHGHGEIEIVNRRAGETTTYHGNLTPTAVEQLGVSFSKAGFTTLKTSGPPRTPGDTPVVLELRRGDKQIFRRELWHGDRYQQSGLDEILKRNDAIIDKTTHGELPY